MAHLKKFKLRSKVKIEDVSLDYLSLAVAGSAEGLERMEPLIGRLKSDAAVWMARDPRLRHLGFRGLVHDSDIEKVMESLYEDQSLAHIVSPDVYTFWRIALGVPEGARELQPQKTVPLEAGMQFHRQISFEKGCYLGQELTARVFYTGEGADTAMMLINSCQ